MERVYEIRTGIEYQNAKKRFSFDLDMHTLQYPFYIRIKGNKYLGWCGTPEYYKNEMNLVVEPYPFIKDPGAGAKVDSIHGLDLPVYFTIKADRKHKRWEEYISWLNKITGDNNKGASDNYYGIHLNGNSHNYKHELLEEKEITVDDWWAAINQSSRKITPPVYSVNLTEMKEDQIKRTNNLMDSYLDYQMKWMKGSQVTYIGTGTGPKIVVDPNIGTAVQSLGDIGVSPYIGIDTGSAPVAPSLKKENRYAKMLGLI